MRTWRIDIPPCPDDVTEVTVHLGGAKTRRFVRQSPYDGGSPHLWDEVSGGFGSLRCSWFDLLSLGEVREVERRG